MHYKKIVYKSGYKYQLARDYSTTTAIRQNIDIETLFLKLDKSGILTVKEEYAWDGPSGPTIDDRTNMRASLAHDAKYQLMREGVIGQEWRQTADRELRADCLEDGMNRVRAWIWYIMVRRFAGPAADPSHIKPLRRAP